MTKRFSNLRLLVVAFELKHKLLKEMLSGVFLF